MCAVDGVVEGYVAVVDVRPERNGFDVRNVGEICVLGGCGNGCVAVALGFLVGLGDVLGRLGEVGA